MLLINPVRVKDTGACKADPRLLFCIAYVSERLLQPRLEEREKRGKSKNTNVRRLVKVEQ